MSWYELAIDAVGLLAFGSLAAYAIYTARRDGRR